MAEPRWLDRGAEWMSRALARNTSRRGLLTRLGVILAGSASLPLLPVARAAAPERVPDDNGIAGSKGDPSSCDYWRYCAIDGNLCACCGGAATSCPPGTELSTISWVGSCRHPVDGTFYIVSYQDCCGKKDCPRCNCLRTEGELPIYMPSRNSDITWCFGTHDQTYHCTIASVIGVKSGK